MRFLVVLEPEEGGGYSVHCPALPGCHSQGDTRKEALDSIREAIAGILELRRDVGLPLPVESLDMVAEEVRQTLVARAEDGLPMNIEIREVEIALAVGV